MIITFVLVVAALLALFFLIRLAKGRGFSALPVADPKSRIRPVDVRAFRNLIDPAEESYLRQNLPPAEFAAIHRERGDPDASGRSSAAQSRAGDCSGWGQTGR
jgi:hypothetical protein